jgi:Flp pilus assembly protein TadD
VNHRSFLLALLLVVPLPGAPLAQVPGPVWTRETSSLELTPREQEARRLVTEGRFGEALPLFEKVVRDQPENWRALGGLALVRGKLGQGDQAERDFEQALYLNYESYENHLNFATLLMELGKTGRARTEFEAALELGGKDPVVRFSHALALKSLGQPDEAIEEIDRAIEIDRGVASFWNLRAVLLADLDPQAALVSFDRADSLGMTGPVFWNNRGILLSRFGRWEEAAELFARAHRADPDAPSTSLNLAKARLALGRAEEAYSILGPLAKDEDAGDEVLRLAGRAALGLGRIAEAKEALARVREPEGETWNLRALVRRAEGDGAGAIEAAHRAVELSPQAPSYWVNLGVVLAENDRVDEAMAAWGKALELDPDNAAARENREKYRGRSGGR